MSNLSRRSLVASTAVLPALSLPVIAGSQDELRALGEKLKPILAEYHKLMPLHHETYEQAMEAAGYHKLSCDCTWDEREACHARWEVAATKNGYLKLCDQTNPLDAEARDIAERILEIDSTDRGGDGIRAAAALVLAERDYMENEAGDLLRQMASSAGFSFPSD